MTSVRLFLIFLNLIVLLNGCTPLKQAPALSNTSNPFALEVEKDSNDGHNLFVVPSITGEIPWRTEDLVVKVTALKEGDTLKVVKGPVSQFLDRNEDVEIGEKVTFPVTVPAEGLTDYQVELAWGGPPLSPSGSNNAVTLSDLQMALDGGSFTVNLRNNSSNTIKTVILGVGFASNAPIDENEEKLTLSSLSLRPGELQPLSIEIDNAMKLTGQKAAGEVTESGLSPIVRILDVEVE